MDSEGEPEHFVYPVEERARTRAESARKKSNDKIYPEPLPKGTAKGKDQMSQPPRHKENEQSTHRQSTRSQTQKKELEIQDISNRIPSSVNIPAPVPVLVKPKEKEKEKPMAEPTPIEMRNIEWDPENEEEMIEDPASNPASTDKAPRLKSQAPAQPLPERKKPTPRQSAVSAHVDPLAVLTRLLSTPVQLQVGEVLGVSQELSGLLNESIKLKAGKSVVASSFITRTRGILIRLQMECDGNPITAIIDTGSQLNIVSRTIWKSAIKRPMDIAKTLSMNDANGGEGVLRGLIQHVPLTCGQVHTEANLYVGDHVPFQLLLGRPWQRGNYVSIDERMEGTYLVFKDSDNLEPRYEIMVAQEPADFNWNFDPSLWSIPTNLLVTVSEASADHEPNLARNTVEIQSSKNLIGQGSNFLAYWSIRVILLFITVMLGLSKIAVRGLEHIFSLMEIGKEDQEINRRTREPSPVQNFISQNPPSIDPPTMPYPPSGKIVNTIIRENRNPVVPSSITCSFHDRTDIEIIDRIRSEIPYNRRVGFNNQGIVGSHTATEMRPIYENGRLARRMVMNDAVLITNGDNSDPPNVMRGDIILKQYPEVVGGSEQIQFPTYKGPTIPVPHTGTCGRAPLHEEMDEMPISLFTAVTTSAGIPDEIRAPSYSPVYSPTLSIDEPIPFATLNEPDSQPGLPKVERRSVPSVSQKDKNPCGTKSKNPTYISEIQKEICRLQERLDYIQDTSNFPESGEIIDGPIVYRSRRERRREKIRKREEERKKREMLNEESDNEDEIERVISEQERKQERADSEHMRNSLVYSIQKSSDHPRTVKKPYTSREQLYGTPDAVGKGSIKAGKSTQVNSGPYAINAIKRTAGKTTRPRQYSLESEVSSMEIDAKSDEDRGERIVKEAVEGHRLLQNYVRHVGQAEEDLYGDEEQSDYHWKRGEFNAERVDGPHSVSGTQGTHSRTCSQLEKEGTWPNEETYPKEQTKSQHLDHHNQLYSDKQNSPEQILHSTHSNAILPDNPRMPAISYHVHTSELQYPDPEPLHSPTVFMPKKISVDADRIKEWIHGNSNDSSLQNQKEPNKNSRVSPKMTSLLSSQVFDSPPPIFANLDLNSGINTGHTSVTSVTSGSMPMLIEISDDEDFGSMDMDIDSENPGSPRIQEAEDGTYLEKLERDIFGGSDSEEGTPESEPIEYEKYREMLEEKSRAEEDIRNGEDEIILDGIASEQRLAILHATSIFLETKSRLLITSNCKFKNGHNNLLQNSIPSFIRKPVHTHDQMETLPVRSFTVDFIERELDYNVPGIPLEYLMQVRPPPYPSTIPRYRQYSVYLDHIRVFRNRLTEVIECIIRALDDEDWNSIRDNTMELFVE